MASNELQYLSADGTVGRSANSIRNGATATATIRTATGTTANKADPSSLSRHTSLGQLNDTLISNLTVDNAIRKIAYELDLQKAMAERLRQLRDFEIVIVCDDSGSMKTPVDRTQNTRWDELCSIVKAVLKIGVIFDSNGVDIYFLNRRSSLKVKDPTVVDEVFAIPPSGYTPLVRVLKEVFESPLSRRGRDKKLLVFVATDGVPTDEDGNPNVHELERTIREIRQVDTIYVSFLLCTDDPACVDYLTEWDRTMPNLDVTDDFHTDRDKIRQYRGQGYSFSFGDYVVKALIGAIDPEIDALNEPI